MKIAVGNSRMDKKWKNKDITWEDFISRVKSTIRTTETVSEFRKMSRAQQDSIKDVGGFVGGALREGKRRNGYVLSRSLLTLDMDYAKPGFGIKLKRYMISNAASILPINIHQMHKIKTYYST